MEGQLGAEQGARRVGGPAGSRVGSWEGWRASWEQSRELEGLEASREQGGFEVSREKSS